MFILILPLGAIMLDMHVSDVLKFVELLYVKVFHVMYMDMNEYL